MPQSSSQTGGKARPRVNILQKTQTDMKRKIKSQAKTIASLKKRITKLKN